MFTAAVNPTGGSFLWNSPAGGGTNPNGASTVIVFSDADAGSNRVVTLDYTYSNATCQATSTGVVYRLMVSPTNFGPIPAGITNTFVAIAFPAGNSFVWSPQGVVSNALDGLSSTNMVAFGTCGTNIPLSVTYGPCVKTATGTVAAINITEAGAYIVPGSSSNAVRYAWCPTNIVPDSIRLDVLDNMTNVARSITGLPTTFVAGTNYAEHLWNGLDTSGAPLKETNSPFTLMVSAIYGANTNSATLTAKVEEWLLGIGIEDKAEANETLVTGPDESTIATNTPVRTNLVVHISVSGDLVASNATFAVSNNTAAATGPAGNERACLVTPANKFYTTPTMPYDIRYQVIIEQKTATTSVSVDGLYLDTIVDGTLNPWDMDPSRTNRQTKGTWEFGVDSSGNTNATRRGLVETYEP
jgi:hypothetical protein